MTFVPIFSDSEHKVVRVGKEIKFTGEQHFIQERGKIASEIKDEMNRLAQIKS